MTYALGLELSPEAVRVATTTNGQMLDEAVQVIVPVLFIRPDGSVAVGGDALNLGAPQPQGLITDVVGQFDVDRLFLTEGRLLTPDETMRELLAAVIAAVEARRGSASAGAVTVACPHEWAPAVRERVERIVTALGAARLHVMDGGDAARAAGDAFARLPALAPDATDRREELPPLDSGFARTAPPPPEPTAVPQRTRTRGQWLAVALFVGLVGALVAWLAIATVRNDRGAAAPTQGSGRAFFDLGSRTTTIVSTTTLPAARSSAIGLVTSGPTDPAVTAAIDAAGPVLGRPPQLLVMQVGDAAGAAAAVRAFQAQGAGAVLVDVEPTALDPAVTAAGPGYAVCATSTPQVPAAGAVVMVSTARRCAEVLLLAVLAAEDGDAALVADALRQIGADRGVGCETFDRCRRLIERGQPITFAPDGRPLRLRPPANSSPSPAG